MLYKLIICCFIGSTSVSPVNGWGGYHNSKEPKSHQALPPHYLGDLHQRDGQRFSFSVRVKCFRSVYVFSMASLNSSSRWVFVSTTTKAAVLSTFWNTSQLPSPLVSTSWFLGCRHNRPRWPQVWAAFLQWRFWTWPACISSPHPSPKYREKIYWRWELKTS